MLAGGPALFDLELEGASKRPGRRQGPAASPGPRQPRAHRPPGGQARRGDPGRGRGRARGRRQRARRQGGRRARARHPRGHRRSAADRDPRAARRRRLGDGDQRHPSALLGPGPGRASSSSPTTPRRSPSPPSRRRASRKSPSPRSRRRPSSSARRARRPRARRAKSPPRATATRATPTRASPARLFRRRDSDHGDRILIVGLGNPGAIRRDPPQHRLRGRRRAPAALGPAARQEAASAARSPKAAPGPGGRGWRSSCRRPS